MLKENSVLQFYRANIYVRAVVLFGLFYSVYSFILLDSQHYIPYIKSMSNYVSAILGWIGFEHEFTFSHFSKAGIVRTDIWAEIAVDSRVDGVLEILIMASAILAWSGRWLMKTLFIAAGIVIFYTLAALKSVTALLVDQYAPLQFDMMTTWVIPIVPLLLVLLYYFIWIKVATRSGSASA